jgi:hypothetical protein
VLRSCLESSDWLSLAAARRLPPFHSAARTVKRPMRTGPRPFVEPSWPARPTRRRSSSSRGQM